MQKIKPNNHPDIQDKVDSLLQSMQVLSGKWKLAVLYIIGKSPGIRYKDIAEYLENISDRVLSLQLKELEQTNLIEKNRDSDTGGRAGYTISTSGKALLPVITKLVQWRGAESPLPDVNKSVKNQSMFDRHAIKKRSLVQITPEASGRQYFRAPEQNIVLCRYPAPISDKDDFLVIREHFEKSNIRVPRLIDYDKNGTDILLEDLGETDLHSAYLKADNNTKQLLAQNAIRTMIQIHSVQPFQPVSERFFDIEKLAAETNLTFQLIDEHTNVTMNSALSNAARDEMQKIVSKLAIPPQWVVTHRDFHSRNLMVLENLDLAVIDFQDARMGSPYYDLASFVYDPYLSYPESTKKAMLSLYIKESKVAKDKEMFRAAALQRLHKALGTYLKFGIGAKMPRFIDAIEPCLKDLMQLGSRDLKKYYASIRDYLLK